MNALWVPAFLTALGVGLLTLTLGHSLTTLLAAHRRCRSWQPRANTHPVPLSPAALYGIPPLAPWMIGAALLGLLAAQQLLTGPARYLGPLAGGLPLLWKRGRLREGRGRIRQEVTDLVETLRLYLAFAPTPGTALAVALGEEREGVLWQRLYVHRDVLTLEGPEALLQRVATEVDSADLRRLVARIRAAQAGNSGLSNALRAAADELLAELHRELEEIVEAAPTQLIMPLLVLLLPPALVVTLSPPVQVLLDALAGAGPGF
jgi:hypothetical protein